MIELLDNGMPACRQIGVNQSAEKIWRVSPFKKVLFYLTRNRRDWVKVRGKRAGFPKFR